MMVHRSTAPIKLWLDGLVTVSERDVELEHAVRTPADMVRTTFARVGGAVHACSPVCVRNPPSEVAR